MEAEYAIPAHSVLANLREYFRAMCNTSETYSFTMDVAEDIIMVSPNMVTKFGLPSEVFREVDSVWLPKIHPDDYDEYVKELHRSCTPKDSRRDIFFRVRDVNDKYLWAKSRLQMLFNAQTGAPELFCGTTTLLEGTILLDDTTGLLNKSRFEHDLDENLADFDKDTPSGAIIVLGLDNFKIVNESCNRHFGNMLLKIAGEVITRVKPAGARMYRLDGDKFAVIFPNANEDSVRLYYDDVQKGFCHPHLVEGRHLFCTISAGAAFYPYAGKKRLTLLKHAEVALDQAKREGKDQMVVFSKVSYRQWLRSIAMGDLLQKSVATGYKDFFLVYQPQVDAVTKKLVGAEALLRWRNPQGSIVSPTEFIPVLEKNNIILLVGRWVAETAIRQGKAWQKKWPGIHVSINMSSEQMKDGGFEEFVLACLKKYDLPPHLLVIELTETSVASNWKNVNDMFQRMRAHGVKVAMDDFGTGYSSLAYLKNLNCDIVKIDRALVVDTADSDFNSYLIKATIEVCHRAGISCFIEGVERKKEYVLMRDFCGADAIQGYYFGRPELPGDFEEKFFTEKFSGKAPAKVQAAMS